MAKKPRETAGPKATERLKNKGDVRGRRSKQKGYQKRNRVRFREAKRRNTLAYRIRVKDAVFTVYGDKCVCCGEANRCFLTIDHISSNGSQHRKELKKRGVAFYNWLITQGYPKDDYQILCYNCNNAKQFDPVGHCKAHPNAHLVHGNPNGKALQKKESIFTQKPLPYGGARS